MTHSLWRYSKKVQPRLVLLQIFAVALIASACTSTASTGNGVSNDSNDAASTDGASADEATASGPVAIDATFESDTCEFLVQDGFDAACGWVEVPQNWDDASDPDVIRLHVATITNDQTPDTTPVVYLEGGPGGDLFGSLEFGLAEQWGQLIDQHPLVVFTQRGSAMSEVDLECEEVVDASLEAIEQTPDLDAEFQDTLDALDTCANRLVDEGADLTSYNTVASANDTEAIRQALGIDPWNVLGISYGTRLGQELLRTHPDGVAAIVLDSVQPVDTSLGSLAAVPATFQGALTRFFEGCEADAACASEFPNLQERLFAVLDTAATDPFEVEALNQITLEQHDAVIDDVRLAGVLFNALYSPVAFGAVPTLVEQLENGDTTVLAAMVGVQVTNAEFISNGHFQAVMCHDYHPTAIPDDAYEASLTGDEFFDETFGQASTAADEWQQLCDSFPSGTAPTSSNEAVESDVAALLLSGEYDPITPPAFAEAIAPGLTNSQIVVHPNQGHGVVTDECGLDIALAFFADPSAEVDTSCLAASDTPPFVAPSLEGTVLAPFEEPNLGLLGVRPEDWIDQGFGTFVQSGVNIADQLVLLQQAAPLSEAQLVTALASQFDTEILEAGGLTAGGRTWTVYEGSTPLGFARLWTRSEAGSTILVGLIGPQARFADAEEHVVEEVLAAVRLR